MVKLDTMIKISKQTRAKLKKMKIVSRESYEDVILRLIDKVGLKK